MKPSAVSVTEHLKGFSAVCLPADAAALALSKVLQGFGPADVSRFDTFSEALSFLLPVKSFTTRYLVLGLDGWSVLLTDMRDENCYVDAYAISRATRCNAIGLYLREERRELHVFQRGQKVRQVQSLRDVERWYFREEGQLQPFESPTEYLRRRKEDRLSLAALRSYFEAYTGLSVPDWKGTCFSMALGLERCTKEVQVPIVRFETLQDL
jgi:hypothetical protein